MRGARVSQRARRAKPHTTTLNDEVGAVDALYKSNS